MTMLVEPQVGWVERDNRGQEVLCVTTARIVNPTAAWLLWGSQDRPAHESQDRAVQSAWRPLDVSVTLVEQQRKRPEVEAFEREHAAFVALLPHLASNLEGRFVAVHGEAVVDSDASREELVRRFFARFGDVPVYIGYVGQPAVAYQVTPFQI